MFMHGWADARKKRQGGADRAVGASVPGRKGTRSILPTGKRAAVRAGFQAVATLGDENDDIEDEDDDELEDGKAPPAAPAARPKPPGRPGPALTMDL